MSRGRSNRLPSAKKKKRMRFLRVRKTFRGGEHKGWVIVPDWAKSPEDIEWLAKNWGETAPGGYSYGYTLHWEFGIPPKIWLENELRAAKCRVQQKQSYVDLVEKALEEVVQNS